MELGNFERGTGLRFNIGRLFFLAFWEETV